jgi:hypothetical protein
VTPTAPSISPPSRPTRRTAAWPSYSHAFRGAARARAGQPTEAAADLREALYFWSRNQDPDAQDHSAWTRVLAVLAGPGSGRKSGVTGAEAAALADQAIAALRHALRAGWTQLGELKEPDFDALRGRDDFQKLLAEREAKSGPKARPKDLSPLAAIANQRPTASGSSC